MGSRFKRFKRISRDYTKTAPGIPGEADNEEDTISPVSDRMVRDPTKVVELPPEIQSQLFVPSFFDADHVNVDGEIQRRPEACTRRCKICIFGGIGFVLLIVVIVTAIAFVLHKDKILDTGGRPNTGSRSLGPNVKNNGTVQSYGNGPRIRLLPPLHIG